MFYKILFNCECFKMEMDGDLVDMGFYKNIYVFALSTEAAVKKACEKLSRLLHLKQIPVPIGTNLGACIDEIYVSYYYAFKLLNREGFGFYKVE